MGPKPLLYGGSFLFYDRVLPKFQVLLKLESCHREGVRWWGCYIEDKKDVKKPIKLELYKNIYIAINKTIELDKTTTSYTHMLALVS